VVRIGLVSTIHIVATTEIKAVFYSVPGHLGDMKRLWTHNLVTACLADAYAHHLRLEKPGRWFTGGLLHDVGRLVLLSHDPVKYAEVIKLAAQGDITICAAERDAFGLSHEEAGFQLMQLWQFPTEICDAAFHHAQPFVAYSEFRSGICIANDLANALEGSEPLPKYSGFSPEKVIAQASEKYEAMKKISGFA